MARKTGRISAFKIFVVLKDHHPYANVSADDADRVKYRLKKGETVIHGVLKFKPTKNGFFRAYDIRK